MSSARFEPEQVADQNELISENLRRSWNICASVLKKHGYAGIIPEEIVYDFADEFSRYLLEEGRVLSESKNYAFGMVAECLIDIVLVHELFTGKHDGKPIPDIKQILIQTSMQIGILTTVFRVFQSSTIEKMIRAEIKMDRISAGPRSRIATWAMLFIPIAEEYCRGKAIVSYGQLRRVAREWAEEDRGRGINRVLPQDDKSLTTGIKRLVKMGYLTIPGKDQGGGA